MSEEDPCPDCGEVHEDVDSVYMINPMNPGKLKKVEISLKDIRERLEADGHDRMKYPLDAVMRVGKFTEKLMDEAFAAKVAGLSDVIRKYRSLIISNRDWLRSIGCEAIFDLARTLHRTNRQMYMEYETHRAKQVLDGAGVDPDDPAFKVVS